MTTTKCHLDRIRERSPNPNEKHFMPVSVLNGNGDAEKYKVLKKKVVNILFR